MAILQFSIFFLILVSARLLINVRGAVEAYSTNGTLTVLLLDSTDSSYNSSSPALRQWVDDAFSSASDQSGRYQLQLISIDTQCDEEVALGGFLSHVRWNEVGGYPGGAEAGTLVAVLGGGCVTDSETILNTISAGQWKTPLISYSPFLYSSATAPSSGGVFHFQMYPSLSGVVPAIVAILQQYGWTQMAIISESNYPFVQLEFDLVDTLVAENITVLLPSHIGEKGNPADMPNLFAMYARIIFLNVYENKAAEILCRAFQEGKYYPDYVWMLYGWYSNNWWTRIPTSCNSSALQTALERAIILQSYPTTPYTANDEGYKFSYIPPLLDDSVQLLTQALNKSVDVLCNHSGSSDGPCNASASLGDILSSMIQESSFEGESGRVEFDESGTRAFGQVELFQFRNGSAGKNFASVQLETAEFYYEENENNESVWPDGIPQDGSPIDVINGLSLVVVIFLNILSIAGIIFTLVCLGFNIVFRKRKVVKLTSPNLNYFIIVGALALFIDSLLRGVPSIDIAVWEYICRVHIPLIGLGYTLCLGPILAKTWRIYYIFHNPTTKKKEIKDWHLAVMVLVNFAICSAIVFVGYLIPASRPAPYLISDREHQPEENEKGIIENYFVINCYPPASLYLRLVLYLHIGILQTSALVLAFLTRKIKIPVLNDSKPISAIVFITSALCAELILVTIVLRDYTNLLAFFFQGGVMLATAVFLVLVFVPKMIALYKDPHGERVFERSMIDSFDAEQRISRLSSQTNKSRIVALEKELESLKSSLKQRQPSMKSENGIEDGSV